MIFLPLFLLLLTNPAFAHRSAAIVGNKSKCPSAHRYSTVTLCPSTKPPSAKARRKTSIGRRLASSDEPLSKPITGPRQDASLLAEMLSLSNDGRYPILDLAPQQRRQKTLDALTAQLEALSRSNPVLSLR